MLQASKSCEATSAASSPIRAFFLSFLIASVGWAVIVYYHFLRRGITNPFSPHEADVLALANKGLALTAVAMICLSVALGPMARWCRLCKSCVALRREIGLMGAIFAGLHISMVLFVLPDEIEHIPAVIVGILAAATLLVISMHSTAAAQKRLGYRRWKSMQRLVYPVLIFGAFHYILTGKPAGWIKWSQSLDPPMPGGTLVITTVIFLTLVVRLIALVQDRSKSRRDAGSP